MSRNEYYKKWREKNPEKARKNYKRWASANPEKVRENYNRWAKANPEKIWLSNIRRYNLTKEKFAETLQKQNNCCAICKREFKGTPLVDHDHGIKIFRGLLCRKCNTGLGQFEDNIEVLRNAIQYLEGVLNNV